MGMDLIDGESYNMAGGNTSLIGDFMDLGGVVTADIAELGNKSTVDLTNSHIPKSTM